MIILDKSKKTINIVALWDTSKKPGVPLPDRLEVKVYQNGELFKKVTLKESEDWSCLLANVDRKNAFSVELEEVPEGFSCRINGTYVQLYVKGPKELSTDDLAEAIAELVDLVVQNSSDILETQEAVAELYELMED